ncbi:hypothetical protein [Kitasatospora sp. NPDC017646]|uniref:hypothetical protein n=1 Tax=Kitasatospora sp. NPDC017646 TaxID=3364024 RepID=UPI0037B0E673
MPVYWPGGVRHGGGASLICWSCTERGKARFDTTVRLYDALVRYAADLDAGIANAHSQAADPATDRARADELAQYLAEVTDAYLAADEPVAPSTTG